MQFSEVCVTTVAQPGFGGRVGVGGLGNQSLPAGGQCIEGRVPAGVWEQRPQKP